MMKKILLYGWFSGFMLTLLAGCKGVEKEKLPLNVLFIVVDDLRPNLGCYGDTVAVTPNIDQLAEKGMSFANAYCQQAVCVPSRASFLTGRRPGHTGVYGFNSFRNTLPDVVTLPEYFKCNGYYTMSFGKVFDNHTARGMDPRSWSEPERFPVSNKLDQYVLPENRTGKKATATEKTDGPNEMYIDGEMTEEVVKTLEQLPDKPFFLAVGFRKPHLPFSAPSKYWDLYDPDQLKTAEQIAGKDCPDIALHNYKELRGYTDIPKEGLVPTGKVLELTHGYYACISYVDALIGKLLDALKVNNLAKNTIIVLISDHGFHLGEHSLWCKTSNFEIDARVPLIITLPMQKPKGIHTQSLVELVDLYPTLAELCGLEIPDSLDGKSLVPVLMNSEMKVKETAFTQHPRPSYGTWSIMGYSMRTVRYRYTEWIEWESEKIVAKELYDHKRDPEEMVNIIGEMDESFVNQLSEKLRLHLPEFNNQK